MTRRRRASQPSQLAAKETLGQRILRQIPGFLSGVAVVLGILVPIWQSDVQRLGAMRLADYQAIVAEQKNFYGLLNSFTLQLAQGQPADPVKAEALSASIVQQYVNVGAFLVNVDAAQEQPFRDYQSALNDVKNGIFNVRTADDLAVFGATLVQLQRKQRDVEPLMQQIAGKGVADTPRSS